MDTSTRVTRILAVASKVALYKRVCKLVALHFRVEHP